MRSATAQILKGYCRQAARACGTCSCFRCDHGSSISMDGSPSVYALQCLGKKRSGRNRRCRISSLCEDQGASYRSRSRDAALDWRERERAPYSWRAEWLRQELSANSDQKHVWAWVARKHFHAYGLCGYSRRGVTRDVDILFPESGRHRFYE